MLKTKLGKLATLCLLLEGGAALQANKSNSPPYEQLASLSELQQGSPVQALSQSDPICGSGGCESLHVKAPLDHPINYPVVNNGVDRDIIGGLANIAVSEKQHNHKWNMGSPESKLKWHNVAKDTIYDGNPALDSDMISTAKHLADTEQRLGHQYSVVQLDEQSDPICGTGGCVNNHVKTPLDHPINYPVPNFGLDREILGGLDDLKIAEKTVPGHLNLGTPESKLLWHNVAKDTLYDFNPPLDGDIISTKHNLANTEDLLGHTLQVHEQVQLDEQSDPICGTGGCESLHVKTPLDHPINYPVVNNGVDRDIVGGLANIAVAEKEVGHKWNMGSPESKAKWHNVAKDTIYDGNPALDADMISTAKHLADTEDRLHHQYSVLQLEEQSDPICGTGGCESLHVKTPLDHPINYPVVNNGVDRDIVGTLANVKVAEGIIGSKLSLGSPESKLLWHNVAKDTMYNFAPALDGDMISTAKHLADQEDRLNHKLVIHEAVQLDEQSDPICGTGGCENLHVKTPLDHPINYPVPNNGVDRDIIGTLANVKVAEGIIGEKLSLGSPESKLRWHNAAKDTMYNFAPELDEDVISTKKHLADQEDRLNHKLVIHEAVQLDEQSDPICSSAGCPVSDADKDVVKYRTDAPLEHDIVSTQAHEAAASQRLGHNWQIGAPVKGPVDAKETVAPQDGPVSVA